MLNSEALPQVRAVTPDLDVVHDLTVLPTAGAAREPGTAPHLSIIIVAYQEEARIGRTLVELSAYLTRAGHRDVEVIVVAATRPDGTSDRTAEIVQGKRALFEDLRLVLPGARTDEGREAALGLDAAVGQLRMFMGLDLSVPVPVTDTVAPVLDVVVPVYNEQAGVESCVRRLHEYLSTSFPWSFRITIADNASIDDTLRIAHNLAAELPGVAVVHLPAKGRGRALAQAWSTSDAAVLAYMDVDLSTDLAALLPLVAPLVSGHSDVAIGTRLARSSRVVRGAKREVISRCYNIILRSTLSARFSDAQCGFKAVRQDVARELLPLVEDTGWFFDTEMLVLAERAGLRIHEVPVDWVDDPDSRVNIVSTARDDLKGVLRVGTGLATGRIPLAAVRTSLGRGPLPPEAREEPGLLTTQVVRFGAVGVASTLAYMLLFLLLHGPFGAQAANLVALLTTAVANTAANRRLTFGVRGRGVVKAQAQGLVVFALGLALTSGALGALHAVEPEPGQLLALAVLVLANATATVLRFVLLRAWVFRAQRTGRKSSALARSESVLTTSS